MQALVRLLASVCPDVDGEGAPLDEAFVAAGGAACVRPLIGVNTEVSLQVRLAIEALQEQQRSVNRNRSTDTHLIWHGAFSP